MVAEPTVVEPTMTECDYDYLERLNEFEVEVAESIPEVLPYDAWHDGWGGCAGAECRDELYEPYPHNWDRTLLWCRLKFGSHYHDNMFKALTQPADKIPGWIIRRALPNVENHYGRG